MDVDGPDDATIELAHRMFDLARENDRGQGALTAATFTQAEEAVRALLQAGADPAAGAQAALATARFFGLPSMLEILQGASAASRAPGGDRAGRMAP